MDRFGILGNLELPSEMGLRSLSGPKVRTVFAVLLVHVNQTVSIDSLVDELWSDAPPATAAATVRTHVYHLRQMLGEYPTSGLGSPVITGQGGYHLRLPEENIDASVFLRLAAQGQRLLDQGEVALAASVLADALSLWRGPALADVPPGLLLRQQCARLEETRIHALESRIEADMRLGRFRQLIPELKGLVVAHPLNEWFHARYVEALHACGRRGEALQALAAVRKLLGEELGLDPSAELRRLQHRILAGLDTRPAESIAS